MNSLERVFKAFKLKEVDRVPVIPQLTYASAFWINNTVTECVNDIDKQYKALMYGYNKCEYDGIYAGWEGSFNLLAYSMGAELKFSDENPPSVGIPPVINSEDLNNLIKRNKNNGINFVNKKGIETNVDLIKKLKKTISDVPILSYVPAPFTYVGVMIGVTKLMINVIRNLDFIKDAMESVYEFILHFCQLKVEAGIDCITIADPSSSSTIISPNNFMEIGYPYLKKLVNDLRMLDNKELKIGIHICGNTKPILELIEKIGIDYFEVDSLVPINEARELMKKTCLIGNISPADINQKSRSDLTELYNECLNYLKGNGHILSSGCEIAYGTPLENIEEMVSAAKRFNF
ncbi:MAG: uroporphyrinogen decarboxylase family protein [Candidatus Helarchaeota archaeon]